MTFRIRFPKQKPLARAPFPVRVSLRRDRDGWYCDWPDDDRLNAHRHCGPYESEIGAIAAARRIAGTAIDVMHRTDHG